MPQPVLHEITLIIAMCLVAALEITAMLHGSDGVNFSLAVATIAGIVGLKIGQVTNNQ